MATGVDKRSLHLSAAKLGEVAFQGFHLSLQFLGVLKIGTVQGVRIVLSQLIETLVRQEASLQHIRPPVGIPGLARRLCPVDAATDGQLTGSEAAPQCLAVVFVG